MKNISFDGRVAVVTGAGGGLGREYALELARRGARVVVNDLGVSTSGDNPTSQMANRVVAEIREAGGTAVANYDDVGTRAGGAALVEAAVNSFGRLDIVIINAGLVRTMRFEDQTDAQIDTILNVNLKQGFYVGQPAYKIMKAQGYGRFVFMGSAVSMFGDSWQANYGAAKAGLFALSNIISLEGAKHGILSNVVTPTARSRMEQQLSSPWKRPPRSAAWQPAWTTR
jgi:NAD(P)-dependent dehydrogenase (short-subunit alcohol dehydrogenase family)